MLDKPYQISLIAPSGRLFQRPVKPQSQGHLACFDMGRNRYATLIACNQVGEVFATADSAGNIQVFHVSCERGNNRYSTVVRGYSNVKSLAFSSNKPDSLLVALRNEIHVLALNGKILATLSAHKTSITNFAVNVKRGLALSCSSDVCVLWNLDNWHRSKQLFAQNAAYVCALFSAQGDYAFTVFSDNKAYLWSLGGTFEQSRSFSLPAGCVSCADIRGDAIVCGYKNKRDEPGNFIYFETLDGQEQIKRYLPVGWHGTKQISFVKGPPDGGKGCRFFLLNELGHLALINPARHFRVEWKLRLPSASISSFSHDHNGKQLVLITSDGRVILYDMPALLHSADRGAMANEEHLHVDDPGLGQHSHILAPIEQNILVSQSHSLCPSEATQSDIIFVKDGVPAMGKYRKPLVQTGQRLPDTDPLRMQPLYEIAKLDIHKTKLNPAKLDKMLETHGQYPQRYRVLIYRFLLSLPCNRPAFENLYCRALHPCAKNLRARFPVDSDTLFSRLQCMVSALAHWCPLFAHIQWLPAFIFPFVKLCKSDDLVCFELIVAILSQFTQLWFQYFPTEPIHVLTTIQAIVEKEAPALVGYLRAHSFSPRLYIWPILQSAFSEVFCKDDWLRLWDTLITHHNKPELMLYFAAAFLLLESDALYSVQSAQSLHLFTSREHAVHMKNLLKKMWALYKKYSSKGEIGRDLAFKSALPLPTNSYPLFDSFPKYIVEEKERLRDKVIREENEFQRREHALEELERKAESLTQQELRMRRQQQDMIHAEKERESAESRAAQIMLREQQRMDNIARERRLKQLQDIEQAIELSLASQEEAKKVEFERMEKEMARKKEAQEYMLRAKYEDEKIANLEMRATQRLQEMMASKQRSQEAQLLQAEFNAKAEEERMRDRALQERWRTEDEERRLSRENLRQKMLAENREREGLKNRRMLEVKAKLQGLEKEIKIMEVERERRLRQMAEDQVMSQDLLKDQIRHKEELMKREDERQMRFLINEEMKMQQERAKARLEDLLRRKKQIEMTREQQREEANRLEKMLQQREFEDKLIEMRQDLQRRELEEHKKLDDLEAEIEKETGLRRQIQQDLLEKEREIREKSNFQYRIQQTEDNVRNLEQEKYNALRMRMHEEMVRMQEQKMSEERRIKEDYDRTIRQKEEALQSQYHNLLRKEKDLTEDIHRLNQSRAFSSEQKTATFRDELHQPHERTLYPPPPPQELRDMSRGQQYQDAPLRDSREARVHQQLQPALYEGYSEKPGYGGMRESSEKRYGESRQTRAQYPELTRYEQSSQEEEKKAIAAHHAVKSGYQEYKQRPHNLTYHGPQDTFSNELDSEEDDSESLESNGLDQNGAGDEEDDLSSDTMTESSDLPEDSGNLSSDPHYYGSNMSSPQTDQHYKGAPLRTQQRY